MAEWSFLPCVSPARFESAKPDAYHQVWYMPCIELSQFDTDAFQFPFYRVKRFDGQQLAGELARLPAREKVAVDAKIPAGDIATSDLLWGLGFRKVCMQVRLTRDSQQAIPSETTTEVCSKLDLPDDLLLRHARNFSCDRFSLDPLLPREGVARLFFGWVRNSLTLGSKQIVHCGPSFCTFSLKDDGYAVIDLVSVLDRGKGIGKALLIGTVNAARGRGALGVHVTTECENRPAWNLYVKTGFLPSAFTSAFHLVRIPAR